MTALHVRLHEWSALDPTKQGGAELRNRRLLDSSTRQVAASLAREGVLEVTELYGGLSVQAFSHVGRIQLGDLVVTVEPKLGAAELLGLPSSPCVTFRGRSDAICSACRRSSEIRATTDVRSR